MMFPLGPSFFIPMLGSLILKLVMSELGGETPPEAAPTWEGVCQELPPGEAAWMLGGMVTMCGAACRIGRLKFCCGGGSDCVW